MKANLPYRISGALLFLTATLFAFSQEKVDFSPKYKDLELPYKSDVTAADFQRYMKKELDFLYGEEEMLLEGESQAEVQKALVSMMARSSIWNTPPTR